MGSDTLFSRMRLFALLLLALSAFAAANTVSKPGDWVRLPKIGLPNSWGLDDTERIIEGDPLLKISPDVRNKHRENIPVFRKVEGECDCEAPTCPGDKLSKESVRITSVYPIERRTDNLTRWCTARPHVDLTAIGATLPVRHRISPTCHPTPASGYSNN
jgi:hypothetical protein